MAVAVKTGAPRSPGRASGPRPWSRMSWSITAALAATTPPPVALPALQAVLDWCTALAGSSAAGP